MRLLDCFSCITFLLPLHIFSSSNADRNLCMHLPQNIYIYIYSVQNSDNLHIFRVTFLTKIQFETVALEKFMVTLLLIPTKSGFVS